MDENGLKVLTQEEFDNTVRATRFYTYYKKLVVFERMIVDIEADYPMATYVFNNCKIIRVKDLTTGISFRPMFHFNACEIEDPDKVPHCRAMFDKDCVFIKPHKSACPEEGAFIGWKKCLLHGGLDICLVKLLIPSDAKRSSAFSTKCRCSKAKVLGIYSSVTDNELDNRIAYSSWHSFNESFEYKVGEWVYPDYFDENRFNECSNGIHFFMDKEEARRYPI